MDETIKQKKIIELISIQYLYIVLTYLCYRQGCFSHEIPGVYPVSELLISTLAGDLVPSPTNEMFITTFSNRQDPQTQERGVVFEEYRTEYVEDRTNTFGNAIQAHDHQYDPIKKKRTISQCTLSLFTLHPKNSVYLV